ncbi:unnamed protein product, partial [Didymodactylos carnosus]
LKNYSSKQLLSVEGQTSSLNTTSQQQRPQHVSTSNTSAYSKYRHQEDICYNTQLHNTDTKYINSSMTSMSSLLNTKLVKSDLNCSISSTPNSMYDTNFSSSSSISSNHNEMSGLSSQPKYDENNNNNITTMNLLPPSIYKNDIMKESTLIFDQLTSSPQSSSAELPCSNNNCNFTQIFFIDGMTSLSSSIKYIRSNKPSFREHENMIRFDLQLPSRRIQINHEQHSALFYNKLHDILLNESASEYKQSIHGDVELIISFGYFYCLHYPKQQHTNDLPTDLETLANDYFLPYLT